MAHITATDAQEWIESTKLPISSLDTALENTVSNEVLGQLYQTYGQYVPDWTDNTNTPQVVKQVISMFYVAWAYDRQYAEVETNEAQTSYGATLRAWAQNLLNNIIRGSVSIVEIEPNQPAVAPVFYPNDQSSSRDMLWLARAGWDESVGPAKFTIDKVF